MFSRDQLIFYIISKGANNWLEILDFLEDDSFIFSLSLDDEYFFIIREAHSFCTSNLLFHISFFNRIQD